MDITRRDVIGAMRDSKSRVRKDVKVQILSPASLK